MSFTDDAKARHAVQQFVDELIGVRGRSKRDYVAVDESGSVDVRIAELTAELERLRAESA